MARGDLLTARMLGRIAQSKHELTVNYPAPRPVIHDSSPGSAPISPLTGTRPAPTLNLPAITPIKPPLTLKCLWYAADSLTALRRGGIEVGPSGWVEGTTALACVSAADAQNGAVFLGTDHVTHRGQSYTVLKTTPQGTADGEPFTVYVWLSGAAKQ